MSREAKPASTSRAPRATSPLSPIAARCRSLCVSLRRTHETAILPPLAQDWNKLSAFCGENDVKHLIVVCLLLGGSAMPRTDGPGQSCFSATTELEKRAESRRPRDDSSPFIHDPKIGKRIAPIPWAQVFQIPLRHTITQCRTVSACRSGTAQTGCHPRMSAEGNGPRSLCGAPAATVAKRSS